MNAKHSTEIPHHHKESLNDFIQWLSRLGYADTTMENYARLLGNFFTFLDDQKASQQQISSFFEHLKLRPISTSYIQSHISVIRKYSEYLELTKGEKLMLADIILEHQLPVQRTIFKQAEIKTLFSSTESNSPQGFYDRALLSIFYGCGLRSKEGIGLEPSDIDLNKKLLYVKPSKNYQSRYVPLSDQVATDLKSFMNFARPLINHNSKYLLVGILKPYTNGHYLNRRLKALMLAAGIDKKATLHSLRHSIATHLLQQGMDIEYIRRFLGHQSLAATQIYVRMNEELLHEQQVNE